MSISNRAAAVAAVVALLLPLFSAAQTEPALAVPRIEGVIELDGRLDEPFWQNAARTSLDYEISPGENTPAAVRTEVWIADSTTGLRVAFRAHDPDPSKIIHVLRDRDSGFQDDFVGLRIDTFDTHQRAFEFFVSAAGVQSDLTYDGANGGNEDTAWDTLWQSAATIDAGGYTVELEIPYSSLRFPHSDRPKQWNVQFLRIHPRATRAVYASSPERRDMSCALCQQMKLSGFAEADPGRNLLLNPTLTAGTSQTRPGPGMRRNSHGTETELGLDATWSPTPNNTLSATLNPDFSQVELDGAQLDVNTSFALFFDEKRPFFLESADFFTSPTQLVYTRNIADPDYGARFTGRSGSQTYGVFGARDTITNLLRPGPFGSSLGQIEAESSDFVGTWRQGFGEGSNIGALATHRSADGYDNSVLDIDGKWQVGGHTVLAQFVHSATQDPGVRGGEDFAGNAHLLNYEYEDRRKSFNIGNRRHGTGFRADMGFVSQVDFDRWVVGGSWRWYPQDHFLNRIQLWSDWDITHQISANRKIERENEAYLSMQGRMQSEFEVGGGHRIRFWNGVDYNETFYSFYAEARPWKPLQLRLFYRGGDQIDFRNDGLGRISSLQPGITANLGGRGDLQINYIDETLRREGGEVYHAQLGDLRLSWQFDLRQRLRLAVQAGRTERDPRLNAKPGQPAGDRESSDTGTQLVYSYKFNPRTVFYAGYSDSYIGSDSVDTYQAGRSLFLKFGYGWQL
jgi:hypothetical protein